MDGSRLKISRSQAALIFLVERPHAMMALNKACDEEQHLLLTGDRNVTKNRDCPIPTRQNDFEGRDSRRPGFIELLLEPESIHLSLCSASHLHVHYLMAQEEYLAELLCVKEVAILAFSIFVGHGYMQHEECSWKGSHGLHYDLYVILSSNDRKNAVVWHTGQALL